jgi:hypothetical protein
MAAIDTSMWPISISIRCRHRYRCVPDIDIDTLPTSIAVRARHWYRYVADIDTGTLPTSIPVRYRRRYRYVTDVDTGTLSTSIPYRHRFDSGSFVSTVIDTLSTCRYRFEVNFRSVPSTYIAYYLFRLWFTNVNADRLWSKYNLSKPNHMGNGIQSAVAPYDKVEKKRKLAKNSSNTLWVKPQRVFVVLDDIGRARWNIVKMTILHSRDALRDTRATFARCLRDGSAKNRKIDKKRKYTFFVNFLHVSNRTRVKNGM